MLPKFITSEPRRNYQFTWTLTVNNLSFSGLSGKNVIKLMFKALATQTLSTYISQLAQSVEIPPGQLNIAEQDFLSFSYPLPVGQKILPVKVTYLDDEFNTVYNFHTYWKGLAIALTKTKIQALAKRTLGLNALAELSMQGVYADTIRVKGVDLPSSGTVYPQLFPVTVQRSTMDKAANGLSTVTVTYARIPKIKGWKPFQNMSSAGIMKKDVQITEDTTAKGYSWKDINTFLKGQ